MLRRVRVWIACTASITAVCLLTLVAADPAFGQGSPFVVYSATGPDTAGIEPVVNAFRAILGNNNGNTFGQQPGGRREINWDGGGAAALATQFPTPMITFNAAPTTRGLVSITPGTGFEISGQPLPRFGDLNPSYPGIFTTFSAPRLFTPLGSNITEVRFFIAGTNHAATVSAFGAVFTDVDLPESTSLEYFNDRGQSVGVAFVPPASDGLSFVGLAFSTERIASVRIKTGNAVPGPTTFDGGDVDVVVMDDFIYSEPMVVGP
jgi:hypothetical protein